MSRGVPPAGSGCQPTASAAEEASSQSGIPNAALDELRSAAALLHRECFIDLLRDWPEGIDGSYLDRVKEAIAATYPVIWTEEQVAKLNEFQHGYGHPFTCGSGDRMDAAHQAMRDEGEDYGQLVATPQGWVCPACDYRQFWAHDIMFKGALPYPLASAIEARSDATPKSGAAEGESAVAESQTPNPSSSAQDPS